MFFFFILIRHLRWFDFHGTYLVSHKADWGEFPGEDLTSCEYCFSKQILFTGSVNGTIGTWIDKILVRCIPAHEGEILILKKQRERLLSGGKDGKIKCWIYAEQLTPESATELA
jgi:hypothetical protein